MTEVAPLSDIEVLTLYLKSGEVDPETRVRVQAVRDRSMKLVKETSLRSCRCFGDGLALEVIYKVGRWLNEHD